jgi:hypothetical protein
LLKSIGIGCIISPNLSLIVQEKLKPNTSIALIPKIVIDLFIQNGYLRQGNSETEFGLWVNSKDNKPENAFLVIGRGDAMKERFGDIMQPMPIDLSKLSRYFGCYFQYHGCC